MNRILGELREGLAELRDLAHGLHPAVLSDRGLEHALTSLAHRATVPVELRTVLVSERLPIPVEAAAYFMVCEALTNVAKYAHATHAWVNADERRRLPRASKSATTASAAPTCRRAQGSSGSADRIAAVSGTLEIDSAPHGWDGRTRAPARQRARLVAARPALAATSHAEES